MVHQKRFDNKLTTCEAIEHAVLMERVDPDWSNRVCKSVPYLGITKNRNFLPLSVNDPDPVK